MPRLKLIIAPPPPRQHPDHSHAGPVCEHLQSQKLHSASGGVVHDQQLVRTAARSPSRYPLLTTASQGQDPRASPEKVATGVRALKLHRRWIDTVFLVLKGKPLQFLHVCEPCRFSANPLLAHLTRVRPARRKVHHAATFALTASQLQGKTAVQWVVIACV